jgi:putative transposase
VAELEREVRELRRANEILKAASAFFRAGARPAPAQVTRFIDAHRDRFGVEPICRARQVAPSSYSARRARPPSPRARRDAWLVGEIARVHREHYGV